MDPFAGMTNHPAATPFARLTRLQAAFVVALTLAAVGFFVAVSQSSLRQGWADAPDRGPGDVQLYNAEIARMQQGEGYYAAAGRELVERGYPTASLFNWRTPLPVALVGSLPDKRLGQALLGGAALLLLVFSFDWLARENGSRTALAAVLLLCGALLPVSFEDGFIMPELWAGVLLALSIVMYAQGRAGCGVAAGLAALFLRELAGPYCLLCVALAVRGRRWPELGSWLAGFAAYGLFYAWHVAHVLPLMRSDDVLRAQGWIRFGGAAFVISTAQMNAFLLLLPQWVTAVFVPLALVGAAAANSRAGERLGLTLAGYLVLFSMVGQNINQYWGSLIAPLFCLAAARFPAACRDLVAALRARRNVSGQRHVSTAGGGC